jgi:hypothetical protein
MRDKIEMGGHTEREKKTKKHTQNAASTIFKFSRSDGKGG